MRALLPVASLLLAAFSLLVDCFPPAPGSSLCRDGGCRFDQIFAGIDAAGLTPESLTVLVAADPNNPLVWCTYAEALSASGQVAKAQQAFERASSLGPGMSPVLMRVANFEFTHHHRTHGVVLASRILGQTSAFDQILFSYLLQPGVPVSPLLGVAIPPMRRAALSWLEWLRVHGSDQDLLATWSWMRERQLFTSRSAVDLSRTLWERRSYKAAQCLWANSLGAARGDYLRPQLLYNRGFANAPTASPFDWTFAPADSADLSLRDGLQLHFTGTANMALAGVRQFTTAAAGRYRFVAEVQSASLTTDQRPFFHIFDAERPNALSVTTTQIQGTLARSWISVAFSVPPGTEALTVQLERRPSQRFDNRLAGDLHVYQVSLLPLN